MSERAGTSRLEILDGMRGYAILIVLLYHASSLSGFRLDYPQWPHPAVVSFQAIASTGFLGVELFFFISGFCLFYPFARHALEGTRRPAWREYAYRRFIKIVPSYVLALTVIALVYRDDFSDTATWLLHYLAHLTFLHPLWRDTFASISGPFWTLGVEVEFYVLFPLIALAFMRWPITTWLAVSIVAHLYRFNLAANGNYIFFPSSNSLLSQIDVFATGMLAAHLYVRWRSWFEANAWARVAATAVALVSIAAGVALLRDLDRAGLHGAPYSYYLWLMGHRGALAVAALGLALGSAFGLRVWRAIVANRPLTWLSLISYNLYLWHDAVIVHCYKFGFPCAVTPLPWLTVPMWQYRFFGISIVVALAVATTLTYLLERPLLELRPAWLERVRAQTERGVRRRAPVAESG